jgi:hypothetical protein
MFEPEAPQPHPCQLPETASRGPLKPRRQHSVRADPEADRPRSALRQEGTAAPGEKNDGCGAIVRAQGRHIPALARAGPSPAPYWMRNPSALAKPSRNPVLLPRAFVQGRGCAAAPSRRTVRAPHQLVGMFGARGLERQVDDAAATRARAYRARGAARGGYRIRALRRVRREQRAWAQLGVPKRALGRRSRDGLQAGQSGRRYADPGGLSGTSSDRQHGALHQDGRPAV